MINKIQIELGAARGHHARFGHRQVPGQAIFLQERTARGFRLSFTMGLIAVTAAVALCGCDRQSRSARRLDPLVLALASHPGNTRLDEEIRHSQEQVRTSHNPETAIEQLGWLFVAKARESFDPGFYKLAEQCALGLDLRHPGSFEAMLLHGHTLHSLHRFREAEALARQLTTQRGLSFDYGLLGDILVDVGRVDEATHAYQQMLDLKPDPQGYARAAHIRWLKGDLDGAQKVMRMATGGASGRDSESSAWMQAQLARYLWQAGKRGEAEQTLLTSLHFQTNFPPALLLRGRMLLAETRGEQAIELLRRAAELNPLPEYQWALSDALHAAHREEEARAIASEIISRGAASDPRTCSLFLATRGEHLELAERLAREELRERGDVFTHDALAWALAANGKLEEARSHLHLALGQGTQDARLYCHAAVVAARAGREDEAIEWLSKALQFRAQLLPSELAQLESAQAAVAASGKSTAFRTMAAAP